MSKGTPLRKDLKKKKEANSSTNIPSVKISPQEKALRNAKFGVVDPEVEKRLRAAKFGTYHPDNESELQAKRLEKFGVPTNGTKLKPLPVPLDQAELERRRKRLQRFARDIKGQSVIGDEEELLRRQKRAERFGQVMISQLNAHLTENGSAPVDPATHPLGNGNEEMSTKDSGENNGLSTSKEKEGVAAVDSNNNHFG